MRRAVELDPGEDIILQLVLKIGCYRGFEQGKAVVGRRDRVCLLDDQLSTVVPPLEGARNGESEEQPDQAEHRALGGRKPCDTALPLQVAQAQKSAIVQQDQRAREEGRSNCDGKEFERHLPRSPAWRRIVHAASLLPKARLRGNPPKFAKRAKAQSLNPGYLPDGQLRKSSTAVCRLYIAPAILMLPLLSSSASTALFFRILSIVISTLVRATASTKL